MGVVAEHCEYVMSGYLLRGREFFLNIYILGLKRYYWIVLVCLALSTLTGLIVVKLHPQSYQASSTLLVTARPPGSSITAVEPAPDPLQSLAEANTYAAEIQSSSVLASIYQSTSNLAKQGISLDMLIASISASASSSAAIITLTAVADNADDALIIVNGVAKGFQAYIQKQFQSSLDSIRRGLQDAENHYLRDKSYWESKMQATRVTDSRYDIYAGNRDQDARSIDEVRSQLVQLPDTVSADVAVTQLATSSDVKGTATRGDVVLAATAGVGLFVGILLMLLVMYLDDRLYLGEQIKEKLGMAYLGGLSHHREISAVRGNVPVSIQRELADVYANLHLTGVLPYDPQSPRSAVLLATSPQGGEGKTIVASALALEIARNGGTVVVVDGNLARPSTHLAFSMHVAGPGLSGLLLAPVGGGVQLDNTVLRCNVPGIWLIPGGTPMEEPAGMLEQKLPAILAQLRKKTDVVIIDGPSLLNGAEASIIATMVDSIALIADSRHTRLRTLFRAKGLLGSLTDTPVGVIINHIPKKSNQYYAAAYPGAAPSPAKAVEDSVPGAQVSDSITARTSVPPVSQASISMPGRMSLPPAAPPQSMQPMSVPHPVLTTRFGGLTTPLRLPTYIPASKSESKSLLQRPSEVEASPPEQ